MGAWGPAIFSDDTASDIRDIFKDLISEGKTAEEATKELTTEHYPDLTPEDLNEYTVFWLALAATQWKLGRLMDSVKNKALKIIEDGSDLKLWEEYSEPSDVKKRKKALEKLRAQLLSDPPPPKKVRKCFKTYSPFDVGDIFSYKLSDGRYALLLVISLGEDRGGVYPLCKVLNWLGDTLPDKVDLSIGFKNFKYPNDDTNGRINLSASREKDIPKDGKIKVLVKGVKYSEERTPYLACMWIQLEEKIKKMFGEI